MSKLNLGIYWAASCGGCDVAILDIHEKILAVNDACQIHMWPIAMDFKYKDVEALEDSFLDVTLFNGAIRNSENEEIAKLLRRKSKIMVAFGSCAHTGGIPALANLYSKSDLLNRVYVETESTVNPEKVLPTPETKVAEGVVNIPHFYDRVYSLAQKVDVDYFVPGCPPNPERIWEVLELIISGKELPPKGAVVGATAKSLCDECERKKMDEKKIREFKRIDRMIPDPEICFLDQGLLCLGPVTRGGCGQQCVKESAMPCRGCYGMPPDITDQGAKMISSIASLIDANEPAEIERILSRLPDLAGYFYRFSMAESYLERRKP
jgi:F420-non-reducing hydrogenase small subunit